MTKENTKALGYAVKDILSNEFNYLIAKNTKKQFIDLIAYKNNAIIFIQIVELTKKLKEYNEKNLKDLYKTDIQVLSNLEVPFNVIKEFWIFSKSEGIFKISAK